MLVRLNKYIASSGVASRRKADELIKEGKVKVNNKTVVDLSTKVDDQNDAVSVDGQIIEIVQHYTYIMFHKPKGCITTVSDENNRKTVFDYIDIKVPHLFPVGRLDYNTEGLLIITNDGELSQHLSHPSNDVFKTYNVSIKGSISEAELKTIRNGVLVDGEKTKKAFAHVVDSNKNITKLKVSISEGKNRQIRKMFESINKEVTFLKRVAIGDLHLGGVPRGKYRYLTDEEVRYLKNL